MSDMVRFSLISLLLLAGCQAEPPAQADKQKAPAPQGAETPVVLGKPDYSKAGQKPPPLAYESRDGTRHKLGADPKGRITLINLWATWCAPCKAEMPTLAQLAQENPERLRVLAISQDIGGWKLVDRFYADTKITGLEPLLEPEALMSMELGAQGLPLTIALDGQGREMWRVAGERHWNDAESHALIFGKAKP